VSRSYGPTAWPVRTSAAGKLIRRLVEAGVVAQTRERASSTYFRVISGDAAVALKPPVVDLRQDELTFFETAHQWNASAMSVPPDKTDAQECPQSLAA
jgi:hypothetical protein